MPSAFGHALFGSALGASFRERGALIAAAPARGRADARSSSIASATHSAMMNLERAVT